MKKYAVRDREAGNIIEIVNTIEEAEKLLDKFEDDDKFEGIYEEDFYEVAEMTEGDQVREIRKRTRLTQHEFADKFGIPVRTLQGWELGERTPADYIIEMIERIIELDAKLHQEITTSWERAHENEIAIQKINDNPNDFQLVVNGESVSSGALEDHIETISEIEKWEDIEKLLEPCR